MLKEFKKFALKGNMIDLAVGVIIGGGFNALVTSMVNDIIMPVISLFYRPAGFHQYVHCAGRPALPDAGGKRRHILPRSLTAASSPD